MLSPTIGQPLAAQCTRSWWVRPVTGVRASQVSLQPPSRSGDAAPASDRSAPTGGRPTIEGNPDGRAPSLPRPAPAWPAGRARKGSAGEGPLAGSGPGKADDRPSTFQVVTEGSPFGSGLIHQPRVWSSRPSDNSTVPSSAPGPPSTTAQ